MIVKSSILTLAVVAAALCACAKSSGDGDAAKDAGPSDDGTDSTDQPEPFVTVTVQGTCNAPTVAACPQDYQLVGGGIDFPDKSGRCEPDFPGDGLPKREVFIHSFASFPLAPSEGNGWYCRVDGREPECFAICAHRETVGIRTFVRATEYMPGHKDCGNSGCPEVIQSPCPAGSTVIGGGLQSESVWEVHNTPGLSVEDAEEIKNLSVAIEGNGIRCEEQSGDHWSYCHAMCVPDDQLRAIELTAAEGAGRAECPSGMAPIGGGFEHCPKATTSCPPNRLDGVQFEPDETGYTCTTYTLPQGRDYELGNIEGGERHAPTCHALCMPVP